MRAFVSLLLPALLTACVAAEERAPGDVIADADQVPAARVLGDGQRCLQISQLQNTIVHGSQVIDFRLLGGKTFRNTLPVACPGLGFERRFAYEPTIGQLCDIDTIQVLRAGGPNVVPGPRCRLGEFVPVEVIRSGRDSASD